MTLKIDFQSQILHFLTGGHCLYSQNAILDKNLSNFETWQPKLPVGLQVQIGQFGRAEKGVGINFGNSIVGQVQPSKGGHLRHCSGHNFQIKAIVNGQGMEPLVGAVEGVLFNIAEFRWLDGKVVDTT